MHFILPRPGQSLAAIKFGCLLDRVNQNWLLADSLVVYHIWATVVMPLVAVVSNTQ